MSATTVTSFLDHLEALPPMPVAAQRILAISGAPNTSAQDVGRTLSQDPAIAARILRIANSPFYGVSREIAQVSRAVVILGSRAVRSFVVAICARQALMDKGPTTPEHTAAWNHALAVATASELIARHVGYKPLEEAFVAGLLHDVGQLAMIGFKPALMRDVLRGRPSEACRLQRERDNFGLDHTEAGFRILAAWKLPEALCEAARCHHHPPERFQTETERLCGVTLIANIFAHLLGIGFDIPAGEAGHLAETAKGLGLSDADQMRVLATLEHRLAETREAMECISGDSADGDATPARMVALWIGSAHGHEPQPGRFLLERAGYDVEQVPAGRECDPQRYSLVVADCGTASRADAERRAADLVSGGCRRLIILHEPPEGTHGREYDSAMGVCFLSPLFTALDLEWARRHLEP
ncbi:MAG: HDOD domain-containing protein [Phycisphaerae bacterium]